MALISMTNKNDNTFIVLLYFYRCFCMYSISSDGVVTSHYESSATSPHPPLFPPIHVICGTFLSQAISQCKVQNLRNQTQLSVQGQHALSKVFCSLPGSVIPLKVTVCGGKMCVHKRAPVHLCLRVSGQRSCFSPCAKVCQGERAGSCRAGQRGRWSLPAARLDFKHV